MCCRENFRKFRDMFSYFIPEIFFFSQKKYPSKEVNKFYLCIFFIYNFCELHTILCS